MRALLLWKKIGGRRREERNLPKLSQTASYILFCGRYLMINNSAVNEYFFNKISRFFQKCIQNPVHLIFVRMSLRFAISTNIVCGLLFFQTQHKISFIFVPYLSSTNHYMVTALS